MAAAPRAVSLRSVLAVVVALSGTAVAVPRRAAAEPPAAVAQYTESIPSATGKDTKHGKAQTVPKTVEKRIATEGGTDASVLNAIASQPTASQPPAAPATTTVAEPATTTSATRTARAHKSAPQRRHPHPELSHAAGSGVSSAIGGSPLVLLAGMLIVAALAAAASLRRRRSDR